MTKGREVVYNPLMTTLAAEQHDLKWWVSHRGLTVPQFAEAAEVSVQAAYLWFRGGKVTPRRQVRICAVLLLRPEQVIWPGEDEAGR